ncbi:MAG: TldD/PmbA family protein [Planctomycetota bacterium]
MADLLALAKRAVEVATAEGAEFADAQASESRSLSVSVEKSSLHATSDRRTAGVSVRAIIKGASGFAHDNRLTPGAAEGAARRAVAAAKLAEPDPDFVRLPSPEPFDEVDGLFDPEVERLAVPALVEMVLAEVAGARGVDDRFTVQAGASSRAGRSAFANSCGVEHERSATSVSANVFPSVRDGDDVGSFFDFDHARRMEDFAPEGIGRLAAEEAKRFLGSKAAPTGTLPVVLGPLAASSLLGSIAGAAGGEDIQRGRSFLAGKLGESIASEHVTLVDDGLIPAGMGSGPLDGDGSVRRKVTVVEAGVFKSELHGLYTAEKAKKRGEERACTGHGHRGGGVGPTNVIPVLGAKTAAEIIAETGEGIYVDYGGVAPNRITGEISASVDFGFKIEGGRLAYPLKNTMLGVNVFDFLKAIDAVSSDARTEPGAVMPTIRASGVRVAGAAAPGA